MKTIRLPRKDKKRLIRNTARSEFHTQKMLIENGPMKQFCILPEERLRVKYN